MYIEFRFEKLTLLTLYYFMASWKMHCIYDTPDEEKKAIKVDEDN
jgi:hypothetical protein